MANKKGEVKDAVTFHSDSKPKAASDIEIDFYTEDERGKFYLARNPRDQRYIKLHEEGANLLKKLDGTKTIAELQKETAEIPVKDFVEVLAAEGFLEGVSSQKKKEPFYTVKIPFFRTDSKPLINLYESLYWLGSKPFKIFYTLFVGVGFALFLSNFEEIFHYALLNFDLTMPLAPLLMMGLIFYVVEFAHEFAHTGASYYYGANPGNVGIVFHFLVAFFYVETPDTRMLSDRGTLMTFLAGPLTSFFAAEVCTYMFVFTDSMPLMWGGTAFFWHISCLITLSPFMQTDGYYILQRKLKFPNLFKHGVRYLRLNLFRLFRLVREKDYKKRLERYTKRELRILKIFTLFLPIQIGILAYIFFFLALKVNMFEVIQLAPTILFTDHPYGIKGYLLLFSYCSSLILITCAGILTGYKFLKKGDVGW